jgi:hypothetical protein
MVSLKRKSRFIPKNKHVCIIKVSYLMFCEEMIFVGCEKKRKTNECVRKVKVKVNFTLEQVTKAQRGSRSTAPHFL